MSVQLEGLGLSVVFLFFDTCATYCGKILDGIFLTVMCGLYYYVYNIEIYFKTLVIRINKFVVVCVQLFKCLVDGFKIFCIYVSKLKCLLQYVEFTVLVKIWRIILFVPEFISLDKVHSHFFFYSCIKNVYCIGVAKLCQKLNFGEKFKGFHNFATVVCHYLPA